VQTLSFSLKGFSELFIYTITLLFPALIYLKKPGPNPYSISEQVILAIICIFFLLGILNYKYYKYRMIRIDVYFLLLLWLYMLVQVTLSLVSSSYVAAFTSLLIHDKYILILFSIIFFIKNEEQELKLLNLFMIVGIVSVYIAIYKVATTVNLSSLYKSIGGFIRVKSIFPNPNMYGVYSSVIFILELFYLTLEKKYMKRIIFLVLAIFPTLFIILLTFSRRAWIITAFGWFFFTTFQKGIEKKIRLLKVLIVVLLTFMILPISHGAIIKRFQTIFDQEYTSNAMRLELIRKTRFVLKNDVFRFLAGGGVGNFGPAVVFGAANGEEWKYIDIYYVQIFLEFGLVGVLMYLALFLYFTKAFLYVLRKTCWDDKNRILTLGTILMMLYIAGMFGATNIAFPLNLMQWTFAGLILNRYYQILNLAKL